MPVTVDDVRAAAARIAGGVHRTPVLTSSALDALAGRRLYFKCENLQTVGAFKIRGALNAVLRLPAARAARGVVTHSSGNFAQALALAARRSGIAARIVMPSNAPAVKRAAVEGYGGRVVLCEPTLEARAAAASRIVEETGAALLHPFDDPDVIAGQGTLALEVLEQVDAPDAIVAPIGGGGLVGGIAVAVKALRPAVAVIAAEPAGADDAARSKAAGRLIPQTGPQTLCDGLLSSLGEHTWPLVRDLVDGVLTADDAATVAAMRLVWERMKLVVEPSAAVAAAVALSALPPHLGRVVVVLSGGNVDLGRLPWT